LICELQGAKCKLTVTNSQNIVTKSELNRKNTAQILGIMGYILYYIEYKSLQIENFW